ncbi:uncharacterized protein (DUF736 family) [Bradyrhizobium sp. USDA 4486]
MATIGTFKKTGNIELIGAIVTLSLQARNVRIVPDQPLPRQRTEPPGLCRPCGDRGCLVEAL